MLLDRIILISAWVVTILLLILFTPRDKIREAHVLFFVQAGLNMVDGVVNC